MLASPNRPFPYPRLLPLVDFFAFIVDLLRRPFERSADVLARAEAERLAQDVSLSPHDLQRLSAKSPRSAAEVERLLDALGIDAKGLRAREPDAMRDLERVCSLCGDKKRCRHDLAVAASADHYRDYCPNVMTLDTILAAAPLRR